MSTHHPHPREGPGISPERDDKNICARQIGNWMNGRASVMQAFALNPGGPHPLSQGPIPVHTAEGRVVKLHLYLQPLPIAHVTA